MDRVLDPDDVLRLFSVNRTLVSSKQLRLPTRGMVGNGLRVVMGAVAAFEGSLVVETRGRRMELAVNPVTGLTVVTEDEAVPPCPGLKAYISLGGDLGHFDDDLARETVRIAAFGRTYDGPSSPYWYSPRDLRDLMLQAPPETIVADVGSWFGSSFFSDDTRLAHDLDLIGVADLHSTLRMLGNHIQPTKLGEIGADAYADTIYHKVTGFTRSRTAPEIPYATRSPTK